MTNDEINKLIIEHDANSGEVNDVIAFAKAIAAKGREWQGLTDDELPKGATHEFDRGVRWAEAKLREKNT